MPKYQPPKFTDRHHFNWGFHDATRDAECGTPRKVVEVGPQSITQVSREYDRFYYDGYCRGLASFNLHKKRIETSQPDWEAQTAIYQSLGVTYTDF